MYQNADHPEHKQVKYSPNQECQASVVAVCSDQRQIVVKYLQVYRRGHPHVTEGVKGSVVQSQLSQSPTYP